MRNEGPLEAEELPACGRARLLADLALALARGPGDLESTLRAVVRGAGKHLGDAGAVWLVLTLVQQNTRRRHTTTATTTDAEGRQATSQRTTESDPPPPPAV